MLYQAIQNSDTLKTAAQQVEHAKHELNNVTFDPSLLGSEGIVISIVGYVIVFVALVTLFFFITQMTRVLTAKQRKKLAETGKEELASTDDLSVTGEVNAAIAAALYLHFEEAHDIEHTVLTINKVQRTYSPWSSKIYGLRQYPNKINKSVELQ